MNSIQGKSKSRNPKHGIQRWWLYYWGTVSGHMAQAKKYVSKSNRRYDKILIEEGLKEYEENKDI